MGAVADTFVHVDLHPFTVTGVVEPIAPHLQLVLRASPVVNYNMADSLCVVTGVLPARFDVYTHVRRYAITSETPERSLTAARIGAGRRTRREDGRHGKCDRGRSSTEDGPYSAPPVARCHLALPSAVVHSLRLSQ